MWRFFCPCVVYYCITIFSGWGHNEYGQLGDGTQQKRRTPTPTPLPGDVRATVVAAGSYHSLVLTETGEVLAAGWCFKTIFM